jgi:hypothetical protein
MQWQQGWVLSGEQWPGQIFSFVRSQRPSKKSSWRQIKARAAAYLGPSLASSRVQH